MEKIQRNKIVVSVLMIAAVILAITVLPYIHNTKMIHRYLEESNNARIDFSCLTAEDCEIKTVGCDICYGVKQGCVNKDSIEGVCLTDFCPYPPCVRCMAESAPPTGCECVENECKDIFDY